jgi:hypothetical protein
VTADETTCGVACKHQPDNNPASNKYFFITKLRACFDEGRLR